MNKSYSHHTYFTNSTNFELKSYSLLVYNLCFVFVTFPTHAASQPKDVVSYVKDYIKTKTKRIVFGELLLFEEVNNFVKCIAFQDGDPILMIPVLISCLLAQFSVALGRAKALNVPSSRRPSGTCTSVLATSCVLK